MNYTLYYYKAKVVRVIDADTIAVDIDLGFNMWINDSKSAKITKLRLAGINAYETSRRGTWDDGLTEEEVEAHIQKGKEAKAWVEATLPTGSEIVIHTMKAEVGKFGRFVAEIFVEGVQGSLNAKLVELGYAVHADY